MQRLQIFGMVGLLHAHETAQFIWQFIAVQVENKQILVHVLSVSLGEDLECFY
jgi:hypothetical protein